MRLPHIAVNGMTNCDSLGHCRGPFLLLWACAISHQLPSAAISCLCLLRPEVASRLCCLFCIWGIMVEPKGMRIGSGVSGHGESKRKIKVKTKSISQ